MHQLIKIPVMLLLGLVLCGCYAIHPSAGGGTQTRLPEAGKRLLDPGAVALPEGYRIEVVACVETTTPTAPPTGGAPQLVTWGFRNPFGFSFAPDGRLYVTDNGYDVRGSRPVFGAGDLL